MRLIQHATFVAGAVGGAALLAMGRGWSIGCGIVALIYAAMALASLLRATWLVPRKPEPETEGPRPTDPRAPGPIETRR